MKKIKFSLTALAFVLGITGSVAFAVAESSQSQAWYYLENGEPGDPAPGGPNCGDGAEECAGLFNLDDGQPVGEPTSIVNGERL